jgi:hypothetical protein
LLGLCPQIEGCRGNFYSYKNINGQTLYSLLNVKTFRDFLQWVKLNLWKKIDLSLVEKKSFIKTCRNFYYDKTIKRLQMFYNKTGIEDTENIINGIPSPSLKDIFNKIDWDNLVRGIPSNFHGDLQFDNVLVTRDDNSNLEKFVLLDWRHDFGGLTNMGDLYYDLAKLYGGTILSYQLIKEGKFSFDMSGTSVYYNFFIKNDLVDVKTEYESFLLNNNFDLNKIKILTSLIFLNMSPLHNNPFDLTLYFLGKNMLNKSTGDY